jgi:hypothetical protein
MDPNLHDSAEFPVREDRVQSAKPRNTSRHLDGVPRIIGVVALIGASTERASDSRRDRATTGS